jgi:hypothetical protein
MSMSEVKKEWRYISTVLLCIHGRDRESFYSVAVLPSYI